MSLKGDILQAVVQGLSQIDPQGNVVLGEAMESNLSDGFPARDEVPVIEIFQGGQTFTRSNFDYLIELELKAIAYGYAQQDGKSAAIAAADMEEQIIYAITKDPGWGKKAIKTILTDSEVEIEAKGKRRFVLSIGFIIEYSLTFLPS